MVFKETVSPISSTITSLLLSIQREEKILSLIPTKITDLVLIKIATGFLPLLGLILSWLSS